MSGAKGEREEEKRRREKKRKKEGEERRGEERRGQEERRSTQQTRGDSAGVVRSLLNLMSGIV
jgi:hypothetical protein